MQNRRHRLPTGEPRRRRTMAIGCSPDRAHITAYIRGPPSRAIQALVRGKRDLTAGRVSDSVTYHDRRYGLHAANIGTAI